MSTLGTRNALCSAPSPLAGEVWGGGCFAPWVLLVTPLPTALRAVDLPRKGGGNKRGAR